MGSKYNKIRPLLTNSEQPASNTNTSNAVHQREVN